MTQLAPVIATKKPVTVEAWQWDGSVEIADRIMAWAVKSKTTQTISLHTHENVLTLGDGYATAKPGWFIVRDQFNEFFPLPADVYRAVYQSPI